MRNATWKWPLAGPFLCVPSSFSPCGRRWREAPDEGLPQRTQMKEIRARIEPLTRLCFAKPPSPARGEGAAVSFASPSIPSRSKAGIDTAPVLRQRGDLLTVGIVERDLQRVEIGLLALAPRRLRNRGDTVLVEQPFQSDLRCARIVLRADLAQHRIGCNAPLRERAIGDQRDRLGG